jgi:CheY-like chemotaxis protein
MHMEQPADPFFTLGGRYTASEILAVSCEFSTSSASDVGRFGGRDLAKILVVDDDPAVQLTIRLLLERAGHNVIVAGDGEQGLAAFEAADFDLLFLDIFMPGMDGLETMRIAHRKQPAIPIIVISGRPLTAELTSEPDFLAMATKLGAICSLPKPFKPAELLATVEGCLAAATQALPPLARDRDVASRR